MTKSLEIKNRKNTTEKALAELQALIDSFDGKFEADIDVITSNEFFGRVTVDNGKYTNDCWYESWENTDAYWIIENGELHIASMDNGYDMDHARHTLSHVSIKGFRQIHFGEAIKALENVIQKYNAATQKKDAQIENFLNFCESYRN